MSYDPNESNNPDSTPLPDPNENPNVVYPTVPDPGYPAQPDGQPYPGYPVQPDGQPYPGYPAQPDGQPYPGYAYPPQPDGQPYPGYGYPPQPPFPPYPGAGFNIPPAQPLPLGEAIKQLPAQYLRVLTKPGAATFAQEKGKAAWNIIWFQIAIAAVLSALVSAVTLNLTLPASLSMLNTPSSSSVIEVYRKLSLPISLGYLIIAPIGLFISVGLYYLIAKAFKGQGTFIEHMYSHLLFYVPLGLISGLISSIPFVGSFAGLAVFVYMIILQVFMTMAVHRMSGGKATMAVLILPIIFTLLICGAIGIITAVLISAAHNMQ